MYVPFDEIDNSSRVWIYQADRSLSDEEANLLQREAQNFSAQWAAHGTGLIASAKVLYNRFLVLAVDESNHGASGCSIDSSVAFVKQAEQELNINFFDRTKVAFKKEDKIITESIQELKNKIQDGEIASQTLAFNNLVTTKEEMDEKWLAPAEQTWLARYF